jgi:CHASE3 domain sensor protein
MRIGIQNSFKILAPGNSLRRRTAYSLALVRLILVPVIFLAVYYLFRMGWIIDRIVSVDAPAATLAQQASIQMLEARRAERNYLLLHNQNYLETNRTTLKKTEEILDNIRKLEPDDQYVIQKASDALALYQQQFAAAVTALERPGQRPTDRIQAVVKAYEQDLDGLLKRGRYGKRAQLIDELRKRVGSFDAQISEQSRKEIPNCNVSLKIFRLRARRFCGKRLGWSLRIGAGCKRIMPKLDALSEKQNGHWGLFLS